MPHDFTEHPNPRLGELVEYCENNKLPLIIGADANLHHTVWGSSDVNPRGSKLLEFILTMNLLVMNQGNTPTFVNRKRS